MATFEVKVYKLKIEEHPNADTLELAVVGDYRSIVRKGQFKTGDLGVYIPEGAILPLWLIEKLGLTGKLAGKECNRVKAVKLRGILSQGLVYAVEHSVLEKGITNAFEFMGDDNKLHHYVTREGENVVEVLGIVKYEPPIPTHMAGEVFNAFGYTLKYDIENFKMHPSVLKEGELVTFTEKLHGTWTCIGYHEDVGPIVTSKGHSGRGLAFKINDANKANLYVQVYNELTEHVPIDKYIGDLWPDDAPPAFYILGETFGPGVQDLTYGAKEKMFRVFDVYIGEPGNGKYLNDAELELFCDALSLDRVPVLYRGPFSKEKMLEFTDGAETVSGTGACIREGVVITPVKERYDDILGRVKLKSVSEAYLLRKNKDATEFS